MFICISYFFVNNFYCVISVVIFMLWFLVIEKGVFNLIIVEMGVDVC